MRAQMKPLLILLLMAGTVGTAEAGPHHKRGKRMVDMKAIIFLESSNNPDAWNRRTGARGLCGITPICLRDYNRAHGTKHTPLELHEPELNKRVGTWFMNVKTVQYLNVYGIPNTVEHRLIAYHDGIGNLKKYLAGKRKLGKEMQGYLIKYKQKTK